MRSSGSTCTAATTTSGRGTIEYVVTGTAIRTPGSAGTAWPILTDVSVQDYWRLHSAGHEPVGLLAATAVGVRLAAPTPPRCGGADSVPGTRSSGS